jgi:hypothetical protein
MDYYAGIDVSLELSSVCVVDSSGKIVLITREGFISGFSRADGSAPAPYPGAKADAT